MEGNEFDIFSRLEHEIGRDLSIWRHAILERYEVCYRVALEIEESKTNEPLDLNDPTASQAIRSRILDFLVSEWSDLEASPQPGDFISVTGESFWHAFDDDGELMTFKLLAGHKVQGTLAFWDILPYIDEAGLGFDAHRSPELIAKYLRPFGVHLVLDSPTITDEHGAPIPISPERVYLPIHYEQAELSLYKNPD